MRLRRSQYLHSSPSRSLQGTAFSTFLTRELGTARNIKNRLNRQVVTRTLNRIRERLSLVRNTNGLVVYAGVDEFNREVLEVIDLKDGIRLDVFSYNCSNRFDTDIAIKHLKTCDGTIVFANGNECIVYAFQGSFRKMKHMTANLQKRHKKGGQSSLRFSRLAEESRHLYVVRVVDYLNTLQTSNNWVFGSSEILGMIFSSKSVLVPLRNGGFLDFNDSTINNQARFLEYLRSGGVNAARTNRVLENLVMYLETDPSLLDFDADMRQTMRAYLIQAPDEEDLASDKYIPLSVDSSCYMKLRGFPYIGLKYYSDECGKYQGETETLCDDECQRLYMARATSDCALMMGLDESYHESNGKGTGPVSTRAQEG